MLKVGFIGWRGMVGSVLMQRMLEENDFAHIEPQFFTTSQVGGAGPNVGKDTPPLKDAKNIAELKHMDVSSPAKVAITLVKYSLNYVVMVGMAIGLMQLLHCVWKMTPSLFLIQ